MIDSDPTAASPAAPDAARAARVLSQAVIKAASLLSLSDTQLARVLGLSQPSISRLRTGERSLSARGTEWQLATLFVRLYRSLDALVGGDDSKAVRWLGAANSHLHGQPLQRIQTIEGLTDVVRYLDAMRGRL